MAVKKTAKTVETAAEVTEQAAETAEVTEQAAETTDASEKMITVKAVKAFKDKYTNKVYKAGEKMEITEGRYNEILKKGKLVKKV